MVAGETKWGSDFKGEHCMRVKPILQATISSEHTGLNPKYNNITVEFVGGLELRILCIAMLKFRDLRLCLQSITGHKMHVVLELRKVCLLQWLVFYRFQWLQF
jgi:hypothetical protein